MIRAIEAAIPEYDEVNEKVSLGRALKARKHLADELELKQGMSILDAGIGPGTMTEILLSKSPGLTVVGLDVSTRLLHAASERLKRSYGDQVQLVRAAFEALPFRNGCFNRIVSAYAFRDSRNRAAAIDEFHRVSANRGLFGIVDLGKPHNFLKHFFITTYIRHFMPIIASLSMSDSISGNPWRMIFPTYKALGSNSDLVSSLRIRFPEVCMKEHALGGLIIILARMK